MAYQVILMRFRKGQVVTAPAQPLRAAFLRHALTPAGDTEYVELGDGLSVELFTDGLEGAETKEITLTFRGISAELHVLIYALMSAGSMAALLVDNPTVPLVVTGEQSSDLPESDMAEAVICRSADDVRQTLEPLFVKWAKWAGVG